MCACGNKPVVTPEEIRAMLDQDGVPTVSALSPPPAPQPEPEPVNK